MSLMIGLGLILGTTAAVFAQDTTKKDTTKKTKKKKTDTTKSGSSSIY
jgi:hypothetical protein